MRIDGPAAFAAAAPYTANISALQDLNGLGLFTYQWQKSLTDQEVWTNIPGATAQIYSLALSDFSATEINQTPRLQVQVTHMDLQGYVVTKTAARAHADQPGNGYVVINNQVPRPGEHVTLLVAPTDPDGIKTINYQWQTGVGAQFTATAIARTAAYRLRPADFNPETSARLIVEITDNFNQQLTVTSNAVQIAARTRGAFSLTVVNNQIAAAATIAALTAGVADANGGQLTEFTWWLDGTRLAQTPAPATGVPTLILTAAQVRQFDQGSPLIVWAVHRDELGFAATLTAQLTAAVQQLNRPDGGGGGNSRPCVICGRRAVFCGYQPTDGCQRPGHLYVSMVSDLGRSKFWRPARPPRSNLLS